MNKTNTNMNLKKHILKFIPIQSKQISHPLHAYKPSSLPRVFPVSLSSSSLASLGNSGPRPQSHPTVQYFWLENHLSYLMEAQPQLDSKDKNKKCLFGETTLQGRFTPWTTIICPSAVRTSQMRSQALKGLLGTSVRDASKAKCQQCL